MTCDRAIPYSFNLQWTQRGSVPPYAPVEPPGSEGVWMAKRAKVRAIRERPSRGGVLMSQQ